MSFVDSNANQPIYRRVDATTGAVLIEQRAGSAGDSPVAGAIDPRTGRIWVVLGNGAIQVLDPSTLAPLARFTGDGPFTHLAFDSHQPVVVTVASRQNGVTSRYTTTARLIDTETLTVTLTAPLAFAGGQVAGAVFAPRPPQASALAATVSGRDVSLQWLLGPGAPGSPSFVDAGSAPGLTNLASLAVAPGATSHVAPAVPPGTYYVRVRTRTAGGVETTSNEVAVTVP